MSKERGKEVLQFGKKILEIKWEIVQTFKNLPKSRNGQKEGKTTVVFLCKSTPRYTINILNLSTENRDWFIDTLSEKYREASGPPVKTIKPHSYSPIGQLSYTCFAISAAESFGENKNSFVFPLTKMRRKFICKEEKTPQHSIKKVSREDLNYYYF